MGFPKKLNYAHLTHGAGEGEGVASDDGVCVFQGRPDHVREAVRRWNAIDGLVEALRTVEHEPVSMGEASYEYMLLRVAGVAR